MTDHLNPLEELTKKWRDTIDEKEGLTYFQLCVVILKKHYDLALNETKTAFRENAYDKNQEELEAIINLIVKKVIDPPNANDAKFLHGMFGVELSKYQTFIYREAQKKRVSKSSKEPNIEDLLPSMSMIDDKEEDIEDEDDNEGDESDEGDETEDENM